MSETDFHTFSWWNYFNVFIWNVAVVVVSVVVVVARVMAALCLSRAAIISCEKNKTISEKKIETIFMMTSFE